jgi:hypothetical protein
VSKLPLAIFLVILLTTTSWAQPLQVKTEVISHGDDLAQIQLHLPVIEGIADEDLARRVNDLLRDPFLAWAEEITALGHETYEEMGAELPWFPYHLEADYEVKYNDGRYFSLTQLGWAFTGGAHGLPVLSSSNLDLVAGQVLTSPQDLALRPDHREIILTEINRQIAARPEDYFDPQVDDFQEDAFYLTPEGLVIYYQPYEIAPYVTGIPQFSIPWDLLRPLPEDFGS